MSNRPESYIYNTSDRTANEGYVFGGSSVVAVYPDKVDWNSVAYGTPRRGRFQPPATSETFIAGEMYVVLRAEEPETPVLMTYKHEMAFDFNGETYIIQNDDLIALATIEDAIKFAKNT